MIDRRKKRPREQQAPAPNQVAGGQHRRGILEDEDFGDRIVPAARPQAAVVPRPNGNGGRNDLPPLEAEPDRLPPAKRRNTTNADKGSVALMTLALTAAMGIKDAIVATHVLLSYLPMWGAEAFKKDTDYHMPSLDQGKQLWMTQARVAFFMLGVFHRLPNVSKYLLHIRNVIDPLDRFWGKLHQAVWDKL